MNIPEHIADIQFHIGDEDFSLFVRLRTDSRQDFVNLAGRL